MGSTLHSLVLAASLLLPSGSRAEREIKEHREIFINDTFRANYTLRNTPSAETIHGFGLGFKSYTNERLDIEEKGWVTKAQFAYSGELAFDATFGERNMYSLGVLMGSGVYTRGAKGALEITGSLLRAAMLTDPQKFVWNPSLGVELKLGHLTVCPSLQGYVGSSLRGIGFGLNAGFSL